MAASKEGNRVKNAKIATFSLAIGAGLVLACYVGGLRWNLTDSAPRGLYLVTTAELASYITFCPDDHGISAARRYRPWGTCPDHHAPLLKPIVMVGPGVITATVEGTYLGEVQWRILVPNTAPLQRDSKGLPLAPWSLAGNGLLKPSNLRPEDIWAVSNFNPKSYDSRYFGPVKRSRVIDWVRPLWTEASFGE